MKHTGSESHASRMSIGGLTTDVIRIGGRCRAVRSVAATDVCLCASQVAYRLSRQGKGLVLIVSAMILNPLAPLMVMSAVGGQIDFAAKPLVETDELQAMMSTKSLVTGAETLFSIANESTPRYGHPTRVIGSPGHDATLEYILNTLEGLDGFYRIEKQRFNLTGGTVFEATLVDDEQHVDIRAAQFTPGTNGTLLLEVARCEDYGCTPANYGDVKGKAVLVPRGSCSFGDKSVAAGQAGAAAVILYDANSTQPIRVTLGLAQSGQVATVAVGSEWARTAEGKYVTLDIDADVRDIWTTNIIATSKDGDQDNIVMAGAHSDSVKAGPGINDNGSGTVSLLEIAKALTSFRLTNAVRLAWWSAEEEGLVGSLYYANNLEEKEADAIRLFLDFDMMASPNFVYSVYDSDNDKNPTGSGELRDLFIDYYTERGLNYTLEPFDGRSDYVGFLHRGIPSGGVNTGAEKVKTPEQQKLFGGQAGVAYDPCYHSLCDDLGNLDYDAWLVNTRLMAHSVATFARSLAKFPPKLKNPGALNVLLSI